MSIFRRLVVAAASGFERWPRVDEMKPAIIAQLIGAALNMGAFALLHFEIAPSSALRYLIPNLVGSIILVVSAYVDQQWGFLLLEAAWVVVLTHAMVARKPTSH